MYLCYLLEEARIAQTTETVTNKLIYFGDKCVKMCLKCVKLAVINASGIMHNKYHNSRTHICI